VLDLSHADAILFDLSPNGETGFPASPAGRSPRGEDCQNGCNADPMPPRQPVTTARCAGAVARVVSVAGAAAHSPSV
jgi:hypothetical protein